MSEKRGIYGIDATWDQPLICKQRWNSLEETSDPTVREALLADKCVAVPTRDGTTSAHTIGVLLPC